MTIDDASRIYGDETQPCALRLQALQILLRRGQGNYGPRGKIDADGNLLKPDARTP